MDVESDATLFRKGSQTFFHDEIVGISEVKICQGFWQLFPVVRCVRHRLDVVAETTQLIGVGLHRCAVQDEFLLMKSDRMVAVISEKQRVFREIDRPPGVDAGVIFEELMRENESDGGHWEMAEVRFCLR